VISAPFASNLNHAWLLANQCDSGGLTTLYSTTVIHRDRSRTFICRALGHKITRAATEELLRPDFDVHAGDLLRMIRLWSCLRHDRAGDAFIGNCYRSLNGDDWAALFGRAASHSLFALGSIAKISRELFGRRQASPTLKQAFQENRESTLACLRSSQSSDWEAVSELLYVIKETPAASLEGC
jgi:hypothetical protein